MFGEESKKLIIINGFKSDFHKLLSGQVERWTCENGALLFFFNVNFIFTC